MQLSTCGNDMSIGCDSTETLSSFPYDNYKKRGNFVVMTGLAPLVLSVSVMIKMSPPKLTSLYMSIRIFLAHFYLP